jgi:uncharacterized repeat protein (TIGR02543 family)
MNKKKLAVVIGACVIAIIVVIAITQARESIPTAQIYTLITDISPSGTGSVSPSSGEYESGVQVTLTASPASGYTFDHWSGNATGTSTTVTITMDSDKTLVAHFDDIAPPVISDVKVTNVTATSATIAWATNEPATGQVEYGKTSGYGLRTPPDEDLVSIHGFTLHDLEPNTTYHFRTKCEDAARNEGMSGEYVFTTARTATKVGGILSSSTRWVEGNSPYEIVETVQIPDGITLTIEPGVTVTMPGSGDMFLLQGTLIAHGTATSKITFDGGNNSDFFDAKGSKSNTLLNLEYCIIKNGISFWPPSGYEQYGSFILRHSELTNLTGYSYIWYPGQDVYIEYNTFRNAGGFSVGHSGNTKVYIQYNLFDGKNPDLPSYADFWVENWAAYDSSETIVKYNSFINNIGTVLKLPGGHDEAAMVATENYWGTQDTEIIDQFIYDRKDDITCAGYIDYLPVLSEPNPSTPHP